MNLNKIILGTANFGSAVSKNEAFSIIDYAYSVGINKIDTADSYGNSEQIIGDALRGRRDKFLISTKVGNPTQIGSGLSHDHIIDSLLNSLCNLKTEYIDIYFSHNFDKKTPLVESLCAFQELKEKRLLNYIGCSNFNLNQLIESLNTSSEHNLISYSHIQPVFNIIEFSAQFELLSFARENDLVSWGYSPLAGGVLTGKYLSGVPLNSRALDFPGANPREAGFIPKIDVRTNAIANKVVAFAKRLNCSPAEICMAWALNSPIISSIIIGIRSLDQLIKLTNSNLSSDVLVLFCKELELTP